MKVLKISIMQDEHWWGGCVFAADEMPFDRNSEYCIDLRSYDGTQTSTLFLSDKGRVLLSEKGYFIRFSSGIITVESESDVTVKQVGKTLKEAYLYARDNFFHFKKDIRINSVFFKNPQFNTWMEFIKEQSEDNVLAYAEEIVANGYDPGIIMIDDGWQQAIGTWTFNGQLYKNPKKTVDRLHELGFKVMMWVCPFVSADSPDFIKLTASVHNKGVDHLVRNKNGEVAVFGWWNGYSAMLDMRKEGDVAFLKNQLNRLIDEYGVDGFKFDGGSYEGRALNAEISEDERRELSRVWTEICAGYEFHEFKDTYNSGGKGYVERLMDKSHAWKGENSFESLIPAGCFVGLMGIPFICPDMVGGGSWITFLNQPVDNELFMRMAETSALFPMMQFSYLPWRHTSGQCAETCRKMAKLHTEFYPYIEKCVLQAEEAGEPILRLMEYAYPDKGYAEIKDQFLLGEDVLVAPVVNQGEFFKNVVFPDGTWIDCNDGKEYEGNQTVRFDVPVDKLCYFRRKNRMEEK